MGTSSIFRGNNDRNPLLPSDYEEQTQIVEQPVTWKTVKTDMSPTNTISPWSSDVFWLIFYLCLSIDIWLKISSNIFSAFGALEPKGIIAKQ